MNGHGFSRSGRSCVFSHKVEKNRIITKLALSVKKWIRRAQKEWIDDKTGLLVSFLQENGNQYEEVPVKGSYSALNCYYLTFIDETFAKQQYEMLKSLFWKDGAISGLKEYYDRTCYLGVEYRCRPNSI